MREALTELLRSAPVAVGGSDDPAVQSAVDFESTVFNDQE
jgi:hypothetical protein